MTVLCLSQAGPLIKARLAEITDDIVYMNKSDVTPADLADIRIVLGNPAVDLLNSAPLLEMVQLESAGADQYRNLRDDIILCNASGAYDEAISEHMLGCTLMVVKNLGRYLKQQNTCLYENLGPVKTIAALRVMVIGLGHIGNAYAKRMHMLGAKVYGVCRKAHAKPDYIEELYTGESFEKILPQMDVVALSLPSTPETYHYVNDARMKMMKDDAVLINVGRGSAIDEAALLEHIGKGKFAGVCLDVTETEPLPRNNPLWNAARVYITPHVAGGFNTASTYDKVWRIMITNLQKYLNNETPDHIVDRRIGY